MSAASNSKLLGNNMLQFVGNFLDPDNAHKMKKTSRQLSNVQIYKKIFPNESGMTLFKNIITEKTIWEAIKYKKLWFWETKTIIANQEEIVSHLRRNDVAKWNDVYVLLHKYRNGLKSQLSAFLKELMPVIAENVAVTLTEPRLGTYPLMVAAAIDDTDSILALIQRSADINQQNNYGMTALHHAAHYGSINACETLIENNANIDAVSNWGYTPLMEAADIGDKNIFQFLLEKGANKYITNNFGKTALQLARFQKR